MKQHEPSEEPHFGADSPGRAAGRGLKLVDVAHDALNSARIRPAERPGVD
uniref:Uncharacterized protein n=1 Tax=mine drainage metagenome TaxID=410659 RepID=E6PG40_9ZZZZ